ncbi:hypothetical protein LY78DRAFT_664759 [Colletotrichum sublineola]|nr:hypothetical protein LY78DRAFT_664759 [Colletotrichum sublineola]
MKPSALLSLVVLATGVVSTPLNKNGLPESHVAAADSDGPSESYIAAADALNRLQERAGPDCREFGEHCNPFKLKFCCRLLICIGKCVEPVPKF